MSFKLFFRSHAPENQPDLSIEPLEPRMMLSTVSITASGATGEENLTVLVGEEVLVDTVVPQNGSTFSFDVADSTNLDDIRIEFTNDLFLPNQGIDRNLIIESYTFNGEEIDLFADDAFSSGTWLPGDGVSPGFGRGNILHSNGFIQVEPVGDQLGRSIDFNGQTWTASRDFSAEQISISTEFNELVISGVDREISISRQIEFDPGQLSELTVDAWRNVISGQFERQSSQAGAGIDFFDSSGTRIRQVSFALNDNATDPSDRILSERFIAPEEATSAFLWVWIDGFEEPNNIPLRLTDLNLTTISEADSQPPTATLVNGVINDRGDEAFFSVLLQDNLQFESPLAVANSVEITVIGPDGVEQIASGASFFPESPSEIDYAFRIRPTGGGNFTQSDAGTYEVFLSANTLVDLAGNAAPGQSLGTFQLIV